VSFSTQEVLVFRNAKNGEVAVGAPDRVEQCSYGAVMTRLEDELDNELTGGWKVIEVGVHPNNWIALLIQCDTDGTTVRAIFPLRCYVLALLFAYSLSIVAILSHTHISPANAHSPVTTRIHLVRSRGCAEHAGEEAANCFHMVQLYLLRLLTDQARIWFTKPTRWLRRVGGVLFWNKLYEIFFKE
jgi:hypothetical protein